MPSMSPRLLLARTDGGPGIGGGHVARVLALVQAWNDAGGQAVVATEKLPAVMARPLEAEAELRDTSGGRSGPGGLVELAGELGAAWIVIDGYHLGQPYQEAAVDGGYRALAIDDHGHAGRYVADLVVDQNLGASPEDYAHRSPSTRLLLGPRYALLRREFRTAPRPEPRAGGAPRVLLTIGGAPTADDLGRILATGERIAQLGFAAQVLTGISDVDVAPSGVEVIAHVGDVRRVLAQADLVVTAAGSTCWELCALGRPFLTVTVAANQERVATNLAAAGVTNHAGLLADLSPRILAEQVADLAADSSQLATLAAAGRALVDGGGASRVVRAMTAAGLQLRLVEPGDAELLWTWANEPEVRRRAFSSDPIPWEVHRAWLAQRLADPSCTFLMAMDERGQAVGQIRADLDGRDAEISISVAAGARGRGLGSALIDAATHYLFQHTNASVLHAYIKPDNAASRAAFERAGFVDTGEVHRAGFDGIRHLELPETVTTEPTGDIST